MFLGGVLFVLIDAMIELYLKLKREIMNVNYGTGFPKKLTILL